MKRLLIVVFLVVFIGFVSVSSFVLGYLASNSSMQFESPVVVTSVNSEKLLLNVNTWRDSKKLSTYSHSPWLCDQATLRAYDIQTDNSHTGFHTRFGNKYDIAENLSEGYSEETALNAWLNSPLHAKNLNADYDYSCIRCINDRCVQLFANL